MLLCVIRTSIVHSEIMDIGYIIQPPIPSHLNHLQLSAFVFSYSAWGGGVQPGVSVSAHLSLLQLSENKFTLYNHENSSISN